MYTETPKLRVCILGQATPLAWMPHLVAAFQSIADVRTLGPVPNDFPRDAWPGEWPPCDHVDVDLFVARLFSEINEIDMTVTGGALRTPFGSFAAPGLIEGERATLCIRRRAIREAGRGDKGLPARVIKQRFLGDLVLVELVVEGFDQPLTMLTREDLAPPRDRDLALTIDPSGVLVFPAS